MQVSYKYPPKPVGAYEHTVAGLSLNNHVTLSDVISLRTIFALNAYTTDFFTRIGCSNRDSHGGELLSQWFLRFLRNWDKHFRAVFRKKRNVTVVKKRFDKPWLSDKIPNRILS